MNDTITLFQQPGLYIVEGPYQRTYVSMCIKAGCEVEAPGHNGLAHLVEHISLSYRLYHPILSARNDKYLKSDFQFSGCTNYGQTVLHMSFPPFSDNIMKFSEILRGIYSINVLQEDVFEIARSEILEECHSMKNHWDWQRRIIQFITDNQVDVLPVGNVRDIKGFEIKDAVTFMNTFYSTGNCALIIQTSLPIDDIKNLVLPIVEEYINFSDPEYIIPTKLTGNCSDAINDELVRTVFLDNSTGLTLMEFFFQRAYERLDLEKKITRMLFEIISKIRIRDYINNSNNHDGFQDNFVSDKHISEHYYYTVFTLQFLQPIKNASDFAEEAVLFLKQYEISEAELLHAKQILTDFMNETNLTTHDDIFENLSANFFYEEPIHITVQHYDQIKSIMDRIKLADVKTYKCWALTGPCKIVISS